MARQPNDEEKKVAIDKKSGSLAYNRLDMQLSQTLHIDNIKAYPVYDSLTAMCSWKVLKSLHGYD